jgi:N-methylhydantoinase B
MAEPGAPAPRLSIFGVDDAGQEFHTLLLTSAGLGARCDRDGAACKAFPTNTSLSSIEMIESTMPLRFAHRRLVPDSGGGGRFRGGLGQEIAVANAGTRPCTVATTLERVGRESKGLFGGGQGAANGVFDGDGAAVVSQGRLVLGPGERIVVRTAGGGGWGDPRDRDPELVQRDVEHGYVSRDAARAVYGRGEEDG